MRIKCHENGGVVERTVLPIVRDPDLIDEVEAKVRKVPNFLFGGESLWSTVSQPGSAFFLVDDVGMLGVVNIKQGYYGEAHITFWDKILEGREELCKEVADFVMEAANLSLLLTYIPDSRERLIKFAIGVGFKPLERANGAMILVLQRERAKWD